MTISLNSKTFDDIGLTFDDVLLRPKHSKVMPCEVTLKTRLAGDIFLNLPLLSAAMDSVSEADMALAMAQAGGLGVLHRNMSIHDQCEEVLKVKKFVSAMVRCPLTISPDATLGEAKAMMEQHRISGIPVVENYNEQKKAGKLVGILTHRDVRFACNLEQPVHELMSHENLITAKQDIGPQEAQKLLHQHRIEKLLIVDEDGYCVGLITVKDIEKSHLAPGATKDSVGRLRVGAAIGVGEQGFLRSTALIDAGVDVLVLDTAHGHSDSVLDQIVRIKKHYPKISLIAGNVATKEGTKALIDHGADCVKVGIGPGSICTTRIVAGVGVPQLTALMEAAEEGQKANIPILADGGIKFSGDFAKALATGASAAMIGSLIAGTKESPGEMYLYQGRPFKVYRGMGSMGAMQQGASDRYFQGHIQEAIKLVPEGVEGQVAYKGPVSAILYQMAGGLRASMGYVGAKNLTEFHEKAEFIRISAASLRESHTHNVSITKESPNYPSKS